MVPVKPLHEELVLATLEGYRKVWSLARQAAEPFWMQHDLTISQLKALVILDARGSLTVSLVATRLGIGRPSASILVEQLVQQNLVAREEDRLDRRRSLVSLTDAGREFMERLYHLYDPLGGWLEQLTDRDLESLVSGFRALIEVIERSTAEVSE
jgi:DNA-binding MarR family transcriptional regulator